jgi:purine-binding chemotaxis protein CheW
MAQTHVDPNSAPTAASSAESPHQFLTFILGGELFAMDILSIKEIIEYADLTAVPMMPEYVRGVINLRGSVVPVIDLCVRFGKPATPVTKRTCIVIVEIRTEAERHIMGVVVDAVNAVLDIPRADIEPAPTYGTRIRADFIQGLAKVNGNFVILLDVNHVLATDEIDLLTQSEQTAAVA